MFKFNVLMAFLAAPFLALFLVCYDFVEDSSMLQFPTVSLEEGAVMLQQETEVLRQSIGDLGMLARTQVDIFSEQYESLSALSEKACPTGSCPTIYTSKRYWKCWGPPFPPIFRTTTR